MGLRVGERALLVGLVACGEVRRLGPRRYAARDRRWRPLGPFATERAAALAIVRANQAADQEAARAEARDAARPEARVAPSAAPARRKRGRRRPMPRRLRVGDSVRVAGGEVRHDGRRRYLATDPDGRAAGAFTTLRRALEALSPARR